MIEIGEEVRKLYGKELAGTRKPKRRSSSRWIAVVIMGIAAAVVFFFSSVYYYNAYATLEQRCYAQQGQIEKEYQRRADLVPQLIEVAKDYARHEQRLFRYVADTHSLFESARKLEKSLVAKNPSIEQALAGLVALAEQYPELKATGSFQDLMDKLEVTEDRIASMRESYVDSVRQYNTLRATFPSGFLNYFFRFGEIGYYRARDVAVPRIPREEPAQGGSR